MSTTYRHEMPGGATWSATVPAGRSITITALGPDANASLLLFAADRLDRLNLPDTLKAQMSACVRPPMTLMSDRGLALASVTHSTLAWHDCLTGFGHEAHLARFAPTSYQVERNDWRRPARSELLLELAKYGLGEADLHGCVNLFTKVAIADDTAASLAWQAGHTVAGDTVTLRTEVDLLVVLSTAQHPLATFDHPVAGVEVAVGPAAPVAADDPSIAFRDETARSLEMSRRVLA
ncbi:hypothetical protein BJ993_001603 [Nocardioides aromaticivorans]|uniref:DUF1989 domain-containing protein n=1 Tax=Nocardioides aromaticivorans TaxID=200618 RepID=A0A7Y9ZHC1_9ACTN|nr:DUF1989 domain-containing protein [Nocardioides aromaticivorans]NYI44523.1 hypothetical protein [Nocardioides aromaticivorans]